LVDQVRTIVNSGSLLVFKLTLFLKLCDASCDWSDVIVGSRGQNGCTGDYSQIIVLGSVDQIVVQGSAIPSSWRGCL